MARLPAISSLTSRPGRPSTSASSIWLQPRASISSLISSPGEKTSAGVLSIISMVATPLPRSLPHCRSVVILNADHGNEFVGCDPLELDDQPPLLVKPHGVLVTPVALQLFEVQRPVSYTHLRAHETVL